MTPQFLGTTRSLQKWLGSLRDIEGILGSFFVSAEGDVLEADFPPAFQAVASSVGQRVARLRDALSLGGSQVSTLTVRYPHHKLALRSVSGGVLVVLAVATVNDAALRTAMHLVGQRCLEAGADFHAFTPPTPLAREPTQTLVSSISVLEGTPARSASSDFLYADRTPSPDRAPSSDRPSSTDRPSSSDRPSSPDRPSVNSQPPEAGLPLSSRKPRSVLFRGKRIG
jgi:predicted regulator of Ras-like GTPase activity (Roadblock/LC7/MglB family)